MFSQFKSELRQLPYMLGKLLGGILAVVGFTAVVVMLTRKSSHSAAGTLLPAFLGGSGILVFVLSSRLLAKRLSGEPAELPGSGDRTRTSMLSWAILLLFVAVFLLFTYVVSR